MSEKPEALRVAERCESLASIADAYSEEAYLEAAAELRRLHAINAELAEALQSLLEAADSMCGTFGCILGETPEHEDTHTHDKWAEDFLKERAAEARAAIAKATGEQP